VAASRPERSSLDSFACWSDWILTVAATHVRTQEELEDAHALAIADHEERRRELKMRSGHALERAVRPVAQVAAEVRSELSLETRLVRSSELEVAFRIGGRPLSRFLRVVHAESRSDSARLSVTVTRRALRTGEPATEEDSHER
jgi:hypothetical protein